MHQPEGACDVLPSDDPEQEESMETHEPSEGAAAAQSSETNAAPPKPQYSYRSVSSARSLTFNARFWLNSLSKTEKSRLPEV